MEQCRPQRSHAGMSSCFGRVPGARWGAWLRVVTPNYRPIR